MTKPDGSKIFWGSYQSWSEKTQSNVWYNTFPEQWFLGVTGHLSRFSGIHGNGVEYGDPYNEGNWSDPGL